MTPARFSRSCLRAVSWLRFERERPPLGAPPSSFHRSIDLALLLDGLGGLSGMIGNIITNAEMPRPR
jgi:hypothetical protein